MLARLSSGGSGQSPLIAGRVIHKEMTNGYSGQLSCGDRLLQEHDMSNSEYTLIFGLGPKNDGKPNTDVELAIALAAIEDASLKNCGGFTIHRGKGGWIDPASQKTT
jgi:hypothetical protein